MTRGIDNPARLNPLGGEWLERDRPLAFEFEGRALYGFAGDTIASALWANDVRVLGRSFKYHRPRGILSFANHDANILLQDGARLNLRADVEPLYAGARLHAVNTFGGVARDRAAVLGALARFLPVGFYYKAFHGRLFPWWERVFRRLSGLGALDLTDRAPCQPKRYEFCEVLVIGAGPSGLAAALAAAEQGADVLLIDETARLGGSAHYQRGGVPMAPEVQALCAAVIRHPRIRIQYSTLAAGYYADHWLPLVSDAGLGKLRARAVVVASGAIEQPAVFRNNDLPGVMLASAAQRLIWRHAVRPMRRAVVLTANADGYRAALDLVTQGIEVAALADLRAQPVGVEPLLSALAARGVPLLTGHCILEARPDRAGILKAVQLARFDGRNAGAHGMRIECDGVLMSCGWAGAAALLYQAGTRMRYASELEQFVPATLPPGVFACGKVAGAYALGARLADGERAGSAAAAHCGHGAPRRVTVAPEPVSPSHPWPIVAHPRGKNFVDFDEDLQLSDLENAIAEGFDNIELLKRYATVGMGPSQGKHSNMNALRILAHITGQRPEQVGTTTARPFYHPVPMGQLAGRGFAPERATSLASRHTALGAVWMAAGAWQRPAYYAHDGLAREPSIRAEVEAVRRSVGLIDVGTLGKLEVRGPQAAELLERVYAARYATLKPGMSRYALMCDEAGVVIDDGVVARLAPEHFYFSTTTSGAASVYRELSRLLTIWRLDCTLASLTGAMAAVNLAGPAARRVLARLTTQDLSNAAFPYLAVREAPVAGIPARLLRVGFVGELGYEIHVATQYAGALWDALLAAGAPEHIRPFGVEAQRLLRLEKGHLIVGQDSDGLSTPFDLAADWAVKLDKPFFVGQRSLQAIQRRAEPRPQLRGFVLDPAHEAHPPQECNLVIAQHAGREEIAGRVTSIAWSPTLGRHIGLAFVPPSCGAPGSDFTIRRSDGLHVRARVVATPFYDPDNLRQRDDETLPPAAAHAAPRRWQADPDVPHGAAQATACAVTDLSWLPRWGLKGREAGAWLTARGLAVPANANHARMHDGLLLLRLGLGEYLLEAQDEAAAARLDTLAAAADAPGLHPLPRPDLALRLSGPRLQELLRQVCNIDFSAIQAAPTPEAPVVLTLMAGVAVTVLPGGSAAAPDYRVWCDPSWGPWLWRTLTGIAAELGGGGFGGDPSFERSPAPAPIMLGA